MYRFLDAFGADDERTLIECAKCYALSKTVKKKRMKKIARTQDEFRDDLTKDMKVSSKGRLVSTPGTLTLFKDQQPYYVFDFDKVDAYELGWLDRIGYKAGRNVIVNVVRYTDIATVTLADHVPMYMVCDVRWPAPRPN